MPRYSSSVRSYSPSTSGVTTELGIVWSSSGGHTHDGVESSLINGESYSMFDFRPASRTTTIDRDNIQSRNRLALREFIANTIRDDFNIVLEPDTIGASNIIAGSITTDLLATNAITSLNYSYTSGDYSDSGTFLDLSTGVFRSENFAITVDGDGKFKGELQAAGGSLASFKITGSGLTTLDGTASGINIEDEGGSYSTTGYITIQNYGDIFIGSSPTSGTYNGQHHKTNLVGEYLNIRQTTSNTYSVNTGVYSHFGRSSATSQANYMVMALEVEPSSNPNSLHNHVRAASSEAESRVETQYRISGSSPVYHENIFISDASGTYANVVADNYSVLSSATTSRGLLEIYENGLRAFSASTEAASGGYVQVGDTTSDYVRIRANGYISGNPVIMSDDLTIRNSSPAINLIDTTSGAHDYQIALNSNSFYIQYDSNSDGTWDNVLVDLRDTTSINFYVANAYVNGGRVWHSNNDGSGSGLDADTLDGSHASSFATSGHTHTSSLDLNGTLTSDYVIVNGTSSSEGGEIRLDQATSASYTRNAHLDNYQDRFRVHNGTATVFEISLNSSSYTNVYGDMYAYRLTGSATNNAARILARDGSTITLDYNGSSVDFWLNDNANGGGGGGTKVKTFVINHPTDDSKYLVHAVAEGATSDVFYRGEGRVKNGECVILLPHYFEELTNAKGRTVTLTPIYNGFKTGVLSCSKVVDGKFTVYSTDQSENGQEFYWRVDAVRKNTEFNVEPDKSNKKLMGDGPYTYLV